MKTTFEFENPDYASIRSASLQSENLKDVLASLSPERREEVEKLAAELAKNNDVRMAAELLEKSQTLGPKLDDVKFAGELGWLTALAAAIAIIAI